LEQLGLVGDVERLACEILPNQTVVARVVKTGMGFVVMPADGDGTPAPAARREQGSESAEHFGVQNLPASVFNTNLGHELRTPLNHILGDAGMLMEEAHDHNVPRMADDLKHVYRQAADLLELVDAGLAAARINAEEVRVQRLTFAISELMDDAAAAFEAEASRRGNRVEVHAMPHLGEMRADPTHLREALRELLRWASNRTRDGVLHLDAEIELDSENAEWVLLLVSDSGTPLSDAAAAGLFQVFAGSDGATGHTARTIRRGVVRKLCRNMKGDVLVSQTAQGRRALAIRMPRGR
jgi:signal transduction histidine kinase